MPCKISWLYFLMSSLALCLMVLHISAYSIRCFLSPFPAIYRPFFIRARVVDDILDWCGFLIALASIDALYWIMSVSSCSVSIRFFNSRWNSIFFYSIRMTSTFGGVLVINLFLFTCTSSLMLLIASPWSLPMLTWFTTVTYVTVSGLFVRM